MLLVNQVTQTTHQARALFSSADCPFRERLFGRRATARFTSLHCRGYFRQHVTGRRVMVWK
ncbi:hypothetical protein KCP71_22115 [Salmonella enterica subsp. enterica]|nr:hypothetical protein KCP71_22115 [Salmonella enterica subsp. enterica]